MFYCSNQVSSNRDHYFFDSWNVPEIFGALAKIYPEYSNWFFLGGGVRAQDAILVLMLVAVALKLFFDKNRKHKNLHLIFIVSLLYILFFIEIFRNYNIYGISALGEFRFRYLVLVLPLYITIFFDTPISARNY